MGFLFLITFVLAHHNSSVCMSKKDCPIWTNSVFYDRIKQFSDYLQ